MVGGVHELQVLGDELEVDEAAAHLLELPGVARALLLLDARAHVADVGGGLGPVARLVRSTSRMAVSTAAPQRRRAGDDAGPGQRHVLPGPGLARLVVDEARELRGDRPLLAGGPQAHVDVVEDAFGGRAR